MFNAPIGDVDWSTRVYQNFIAKNLGFSNWIGHHGGNTLTGQSPKELHHEGGWVGRDTDNSPYAALNHKWIYMFGDSTTRQIWASFASPFKGNKFERNAKEWTRHYCGKQEKRAKHVKDGIFDEEGWRGPCGVNAVTCHISGYGDQGVLSYDWKHFPYEDYDEFMWGDKGPWMVGFGGEGIRRPDGTLSIARKWSLRLFLCIYSPLISLLLRHLQYSRCKWACTAAGTHRHRGCTAST